MLKTILQSKIVEANINFNNLNATHFISFIDGNIIEECIDGENIIWHIDYVLNDINNSLIYF